MNLTGGKWKAIVLISVSIALHLSPCALQAQERTRITPATITTLPTSTPTSTSSAAGHNTANPFATDSASRDSNEVKGLIYHKETPDSVLRRRVFMFHHEPLQVKINRLWNPTLDPTGVQFADRLDALNGNYYLSKGIVGQPHYALYPTLITNLVTQLQPDPNIGYSKRSSNIWLYQTMTPFTTLGYHSSLDKDYQLHLTHTQNIRPGWNLAFNYDLLCPEGVYTSSGVKNHYLDATTNYFSPDSRLQAAAGIIWQSFNIDENGGIASDSYLTSSANRAGIPVNLYNSGTMHRESELFGRITYNLVQQVDHYRQRDNIVARQINDTLTVMDTVKLTDTLHVGTPKIINAGVIGLALNQDRRKRVFTDSTLWTLHSADIFWTNDAYPDHRWRNPLKITAGINLEHENAVISGDTMRLFCLMPYANVDINLGLSTLTTQAMFAIDRPDEADYLLNASFTQAFDSATNTQLTLSATSERKSPDLLFVHDARYTQFLTLQFSSGEWINLMVCANHLSHNVWYDTALLVHQGTSPLWLCQAALTTHLHLGWLHLDMQQLLQHSTDNNQLPVPLWASKNSIYADFWLFSHVLRMQTGVDLRYHTAFYSPAYDYRTGVFCHQSETPVGGYLWGDLFINLQVKRASIYLKAGHINAIWETHPTYFLLPHYPGRRFGLYWGITWNFFD